MTGCRPYGGAPARPRESPPHERPRWRRDIRSASRAWCVAIPTEPAASVAIPDIRLVSLVKRYGDVAAGGGVGLEIARGEFFTLSASTGFSRLRPLGDSRRSPLSERTPRRAAKPGAAPGC